MLIIGKKKKKKRAWCKVPPKDTKEKEEQSKSKVCERKKVIKTRANITNTETDDSKLGSLKWLAKWINS